MSSIIRSLFLGFPLPSYVENNALKRSQPRFLLRPVSSQISCPQGIRGYGPPLIGRSWQCDLLYFVQSVLYRKALNTTVLRPQRLVWGGKRKEDSQGELLWCYLNISSPVLISSRPPRSMRCRDCSLNTLAQKAGFSKVKAHRRGPKQGRKFKFQSTEQPFASKPSFPSLLVSGSSPSLRKCISQLFAGGAGSLASFSSPALGGP